MHSIREVARVNVELQGDLSDKLSFVCDIVGSLPGIFIIEQMMEHVARTLSLDPIVVKTQNLYKQGQVSIVSSGTHHKKERE